MLWKCKDENLRYFSCWASASAALGTVGVWVFSAYFALLHHFSALFSMLKVNLNCLALLSIAQHYITQRCITQRCIAKIFMAQRCIAHCYSALHCAAFFSIPSIAQNFKLFSTCPAQLQLSLHYLVLHCSPLLNAAYCSVLISIAQHFLIISSIASIYSILVLPVREENKLSI